MKIIIWLTNIISETHVDDSKEAWRIVTTITIFLFALACLSAAAR
jgi:hypothetical protein